MIMSKTITKKPYLFMDLLLSYNLASFSMPNNVYVIDKKRQFLSHYCKTRNSKKINCAPSGCLFVFLLVLFFCYSI